MQSKVDRMEEGQILREYTDEKCKSIEDLLSKKISTLKAKSEKKIEEIYKNHLLKEGLIGEDEKCTFKTLMDYTTSKIPDLAKRQAQFNAQHEKMTELIRQLNGRLTKCIGTEIPHMLQQKQEEINKLKMQADNNKEVLHARIDAIDSFGQNFRSDFDTEKATLDKFRIETGLNFK